MIVTSKRPSDVIGGHQTNQAEWRPIGPFVNNSRPDHATVASIYEEINDLHEETVDIVLAHNWEVRRQRGVEEGHIRPSQQQSSPTYHFESTPISL